MNNLDLKTIESLKKRNATYRVSEGSGLLLEVEPAGAKVWLCRPRVHGRWRDMRSGGWPTITLEAAREAAAAARRQAEAGIDPIAARQAEETARRAPAEAAARAADQAQEQTFSAVAEACISSLAPGFKNARVWTNPPDA